MLVGSLFITSQMNTEISHLLLAGISEFLEKYHVSASQVHAELDTGRIQLLLLVKYRISGKDSISFIIREEVQDSLKITLKVNLKNG